MEDEVKQILAHLERANPGLQSDLDQAWEMAQEKFLPIGMMAMAVSKNPGLVPPIVADCILLVASELSVRRANKLLADREAGSEKPCTE